MAGEQNWGSLTRAPVWGEPYPAPSDRSAVGIDGLNVANDTILPDHRQRIPDRADPPVPIGVPSPSPSMSSPQLATSRMPVTEALSWSQNQSPTMGRGNGRGKPPPVAPSQFDHMGTVFPDRNWRSLSPLDAAPNEDPRARQQAVMQYAGDVNPPVGKISPKFGSLPSPSDRGMAGFPAAALVGNVTQAQLEQTRDSMDGSRSSLGKNDEGEFLDSLGGMEINDLDHPPPAEYHSMVLAEYQIMEHPVRTMIAYIGNCEEGELRDFATQYGELRQVVLKSCGPNGMLAMLAFYHLEAAKKARSGINGRMFMRRQMDWRYANPREPSPDMQNQGTLVVFNVEGVQNDELKAHFSMYGTVRDVRETPNKPHLRFVEFFDTRHAEAAIKRPEPFKGKKLKVEISPPKTHSNSHTSSTTGSPRAITPNANEEEGLHKQRSPRGSQSQSPQIGRSVPSTHLNDTGEHSAGSLRHSLEVGSMSKHGRMSRTSLSPNDPQSAAIGTQFATAPTPRALLHEDDPATSSGVMRRSPHDTSPQREDVEVTPMMRVRSDLTVPMVDVMEAPTDPLPPPDSAYTSARVGAPSVGPPIGGQGHSSTSGGPSAGGGGGRDRGGGDRGGDRGRRGNSRGRGGDRNADRGYGRGADPRGADPRYDQQASMAGMYGPPAYMSYTPAYAGYVPAPMNPVIMPDLRMMGMAGPYGMQPSRNEYIMYTPTVPPYGHPGDMSMHMSGMSHSVLLGNQAPGGPAPMSMAPMSGGAGARDGGGGDPRRRGDGGGAGGSGGAARRSFAPGGGAGGAGGVGGDSSDEERGGRGARPSYRPKHEANNFVIENILNNADDRTTLMIRNIPNKYSQKMLLGAVDENHRGRYDFLYLPIDFRNKCNVGYAFINFTSTEFLLPFYDEFNDKKWPKFNSEKICRITYGRIQGKNNLIAHFQNSSLMVEDKKCRPIIFYSDGPRAGQPEEFPLGPNVRPRRRSITEDPPKDAGRREINNGNA